MTELGATHTDTHTGDRNAKKVRRKISPKVGTKVRSQDPEIDKVLRVRDIAKSFDKNEALQTKFERAVRTLNGRDDVKSRADAVNALRKLKPSLIDDKLRIFISYKLRQKENAKTIVDALRSGSAKLEVNYAEDIPKGTEWREFITKNTATASWLILLLTDPDEDWDWCLFECGHFESRMVPGDRLICLHPDGKKPPSQLSNFNPVAVNEENIGAFLRELYTQTDPVPGLEPRNEDANISSIRDKILNAFGQIERRRPIIRDHWDHFMEIEVDDPEAFVDPKNPSPDDIADMELEIGNFPDARATWEATVRNHSKINQHNLEILNRAKLKKSDKESLSLFGWKKNPETLAELTQRVATDDSDKRWLFELCVALKFAAEGQAFDPIQAIFHAVPSVGKVYRPHLHATQWTDEDKKKADCFHIIFLEDVASIPTTKIEDKDKEYAAMADLLKMTYRFRGEVLIPSQQEEFLKPEKAKMIVIAMERIEKEASAMGFNRPDLVIKTLRKHGQDGDSERVNEMFETWKKLRSGDPKRPGRLDQAIRDNDAPQIQQILKELWSLNKEFLTIGSAAFARMSESLEDTIR